MNRQRHVRIAQGVAGKRVSRRQRHLSHARQPSPGQADANFAGVPLVTVIFNHTNRGQDLAPGVTDEYGWDTHNDIFEALKVHLLPRFDESFSTLLTDMDDRGLLDETLVVCMGEFGRAPTSEGQKVEITTTMALRFGWQEAA